MVQSASHSLSDKEIQEAAETLQRSAVVLEVTGKTRMREQMEALHGTLHDGTAKHPDNVMRLLDLAEAKLPDLGFQKTNACDCAFCSRS